MTLKEEDDVVCLSALGRGGAVVCGSFLDETNYDEEVFIDEELTTISGRF